jgi:hypothetical protein
MKNILWTVCLMLASCAPAFSQNTLTLDLASAPTGTLNFPLQAGDHTVILKNKLPSGNYEIKVEVEDVLLEPLSLPSDGTISAFIDTVNCDSLKSIVELLRQLDSEAELPAKRAELAALLIPENDSCPDYGTALNMDTTFDSRYEIKGLKKSQILKITVKRTNKAGEELEWVRIYKTPSRGKWLTTYSFNFITQAASKEHLYFAKNIGMDSFQITRETNRKWVNFVPGITFSWLPAEEIGESWAIGGSGGIGFDLEKPVVFAGVSFIYNQNLSLTIGAAAHQVKDLNGKYNEGDIIRENLSPDQLMIEPYRVNPFISLSLRFDKNPFAIGKPAGE